jgi:NAD(P)H-flavin reductase
MSTQVKANPYIPMPVTLEEVTIENAARDLKTFALVFENDEDREQFDYLPGQFAEVSLLGMGESPFGIASSPTEKEHLLFTVKRAGSVTQELHRADAGRKLGVRGPLGNSFPWDRMEGKHIIIVSGGFAFTTLRSSIVYMLHEDNRDRFGDITMLYGVREPGELLYKETIAGWKGRKDIAVNLTVDREPEEPWDDLVGLVPNVLRDLGPSPEGAIVLVCGPPIMIRFTIPVLKELGFEEDNIILSLENRMKCGIGKCGRCNVGPKYVCVDGPVFTLAQLQKLPAEY